ncbi:MAG: polysaccharide biosynthesis protein, partial [Eubacteriaceae bacterium]|nr:polysaccharide biosynthesis protein [Eubacteriaceae bacterium]
MENEPFKLLLIDYTGGIMGEKKEANYVKGALIITLGMLLSKFLGLFFKIPLTNLLGDYGMGLYSYAYPLYTTFLTISTGGLPLAVSKLVAESVALGNRKQAYKIYNVALCALAVIGGLCSLIMFAGASFFIKAFSWEPQAYYSIIAISFAPALVAVLSVIRGFFQGMQSMVYSSVSTIIEQIGRVGAGLALAYYLTSSRGVAWGAAGGTFGAVAGAFFSLSYLYISYIIYRKNDNLRDLHLNQAKGNSVNDILKNLVKIALPVTLSSVATTLTNLIDSVTITANLALAGFSSYQATELFGQLTNKAQTLLNVPLVVGAALATSLVPSMSESIIKGDMAFARKKSSMAVRLAFLIAVPAALGLSLLCEPIYQLIYPKAPGGANMLALSSLTVVFTVAMSTLHGILQGCGKYYRPIRNIAIGGAVKFVLNMVLV